MDDDDDDTVSRSQTLLMTDVQGCAEEAALRVMHACRPLPLASQWRLNVSSILYISLIMHLVVTVNDEISRAQPQAMTNATPEFSPASWFILQTDHRLAPPSRFE